MDLAVDRRLISDLLLGFALTFSLFATLIVFPILGLTVGLLTPLPIAFYFRKIGRGYGTLMLGAVTIILVSVAGIWGGALFLAEFGAMGIALSETVRMKLPMGRGVLLATTASLIGSSLLLITLLSSFDKDLPEMIGEQIRTNVKESIEAYKKVGLPDEQVRGLAEFTDRLESIILKVFPSLVFVGVLSVALLNLLALKGLLKRRGIEEYKAEPTVWQSPEFVVWILIAGGMLLLLMNEWAGALGLNLLIVAGAIYLFQGMAIVAFYFKKMEAPLFLRILGYSLILFQQMFTILVMGFGLFDLWFDFRRLKTEKSQ